MKISGEWLDHPGTQGLLAALQAAGFQALVVGGAVRNAVLGVPVTDIDLATDARPENVTELAEKAGLRAIPTGIDHGTVTVIAGGRPHEVTTFRRDVATDGRHATVAFSDDLAEDARRRDFTMNALYATASGQVLDPLGGLPDLLARQVRFVGDPEARIREDFLRILRFFRFHAQHGDPDSGLDAEGLAACAALAEGIDGLSRERVGAEMKKLLAAADPVKSVSAMAVSGVLARALPGSDPRALGPLVHLEGDAPGGWLRRLAVLGAADAAGNLRLSRDEAARLERVRDGALSDLTPAALGYRLRGAAGDAVMVRTALTETAPPTGWQGEVARGAAFLTPPVTARDLMPALTGVALGHRLRQLEDRWLASDLRLSRDDLLSPGG